MTAESKASGAMTSHRLETFCDGVLAIAITLLVLEIKVPAIAHADANSLGLALASKWPLLLSTLLSFIAIGSYWVNHHHFLNVLKGINHGFILLSLFWLLCVCLIPFTTAVLGETMLHADSIYVAAPLYLTGLALPSLAWALSWWYADKSNLIDTSISEAQRRRIGKLFIASATAHILWIAVAFVLPWTALAVGTVQTLTYLRPLNFSGRKNTH